MPAPADSETPAQPEEASHPVDLSRRRLGIGLGASAVFTLASRPVLAGQCMTPSSAASGNLSSHGTPPTCTGLTPLVWVGTAPGQYPGGNVSFHTPTLSDPNLKNLDGVFAPGVRANWGSNNLKQVMQAADNSNTGGTPNPISKEFAAALLNIRGGYVPANVLTEAGLIDIWNDWLADGVFNPMAGVNWDAQHIVDYLRTLQA